MAQALIRDDARLRGWRDPLGHGPERMVLSCATWTSAPVPGRIVEAAYFLPDTSALVLTSDDCPHNEAIHALWIGPDGAILGRSNLDVPRQPGVVGLLGVVPPDGVRFSFPTPDLRWHVRAAPQPGLAGRLARLMGRRPLCITREG